MRAIVICLLAAPAVAGPPSEPLEKLTAARSAIVVEGAGPASFSGDLVPCRKKDDGCELAGRFSLLPPLNAYNTPLKFPSEITPNRIWILQSGRVVWESDRLTKKDRGPKAEPLWSFEGGPAVKAGSAIDLVVRFVAGKKSYLAGKRLEMRPVQP
jgi:hypothetical protein